MPSGGEWTDADVGGAGTRPGFYINFKEQAAIIAAAGQRGIVAILSEADWGTPNEIVELASIEDAGAAYVARESATHRIYNSSRFAFLGGALQIKAVRVMNVTNAAKAILSLDDGVAFNSIDIEALYEGTYGNNITVTIADDPGDATKTKIDIFVEGALVHTITSTINHGVSGFTDDIIALIAGLDSTWITAIKIGDGDDDLADTALDPLLTGANGDAVASAQFITALDLFLSAEVNLLTADTVVSAIHTVFDTWISDRRAEGQRVMGVLGSDTADTSSTIATDAQAFNEEGMVYVGPGANIPNVAGVSTIYHGASMAAMVAGLIAGAAKNRSITFNTLPKTTSVETIMSNSQVKTMLAAGVCVLSGRPSNAVPSVHVERGLTTQFSPSSSDIVSFNLIRTVRIADAISEGLSIAARDNFIGQELNDLAGQQTVIDAVIEFLETEVEARTITEAFSVVIDPSKDNTGSNLFLLIGITPIDAIEMIFTEIELG